MGNTRDDTADKVPDGDSYAGRLALIYPLTEPAIRSAIQTLRLPPYPLAGEGSSPRRPRHRA